MTTIKTNTKKQAQSSASDLFLDSQETRSEQLEKFMSRLPDTLILAGLGANLTVKNKCLYVRGYGDEERTLYPGAHGVKRIIWLACTGSLSIAAIRWLKAQNVALFAFDQYGEGISIVQVENEKSTRLCRLQYTMSEQDAQTFARFILKKKVQAQRATMQKHFPEKSTKIMEEAIKDYVDAPHMSRKNLMQIEAIAANCYFAAWEALSLSWDRSARVDAYWKSYPGRHDIGHDKAKNARHPLNAMLHFAYALAIARIELAARCAGLEIACGFLHADRDNRASLTYDLIEPVRALLDDMILSFAKQYKLKQGDFIMESSTGVVKLAPQFAKLFAAYISSNLDSDIIHDIIQDYINFLEEAPAQQKAS